VKNRSAIPVAVVLVVALLGSGWVRSKCIQQRRELDASRGQAASSQGGIGKLNSFALGLLLGGLKGPLVMALWTSSENQKSERNLDDFDTKVDLIRLLQPEFDTVHLFQIWNKAYNVSVQMANVPNKYTTILDALDYAFDVDRERPENINIVSAIGGLYFDKLGNSAEKGYFSPRLYDETLPPEDRYRVTFPAAKRQAVLREARLAGASVASLLPRESADKPGMLTMQIRKSDGDALKARLNDPTVEMTLRPSGKITRDQSVGRRIEHETLLDADHRILPKFYKPRMGGEPTYTGADGSPLPYLKQFEPFPYGVSPLAIGYNFFERSRWLQKHRNARHAQASDRVVSSRPALALTKWSEEDWYAGRRGEITLLGREVPKEDEGLEQPAADLQLTTELASSPLLQQTIYRYENATRVANAAVAEYASHLADFPSDVVIYASHVESSLAQAKLTNADAAYLKAVVAKGPERAELLATARKDYQAAMNLFTRHILRFYLADEYANEVLPKDFRLFRQLTRADVDNHEALRDSDLPMALVRLRTKHMMLKDQMSNREEFVEYDAMIRRAETRMQILRAASSVAITP
jgi:hypothetical protein